MSAKNNSNTIDGAKSYTIGSIRLEGVTPTDDFLTFAEKERLGLATEDDVRKICPRGYVVPVRKQEVE